MADVGTSCGFLVSPFIKINSVPLKKNARELEARLRYYKIFSELHQGTSYITDVARASTKVKGIFFFFYWASKNLGPPFPLGIFPTPGIPIQHF